MRKLVLIATAAMVTIAAAAVPALAQKRVAAKVDCTQFILRDGPGAPSDNAKTREAAGKVGCKARHARDGGGRPL